jgi:hypothetical protein
MALNTVISPVDGLTAAAGEHSAVRDNAAGPGHGLASSFRAKRNFTPKNLIFSKAGLA